MEEAKDGGGEGGLAVSRALLERERDDDVPIYEIATAIRSRNSARKRKLQNRSVRTLARAAKAGISVSYLLPRARRQVFDIFKAHFLRAGSSVCLQEETNIYIYIVFRKKC